MHVSNGFAHAQLLFDISEHAWRGGGGQGQDRNFRFQRAQNAEFRVVFAEIVAPLGNAVRFIDREQNDLLIFQPIDESFGLNSLGRKIKQVWARRAQIAKGVALVFGRLARMDAAGAQSQRFELAHLIFHERDERRHDDDQTVEEKRRKLVAERFAPAGRHHGERVFAFQDGIQNRHLAFAEFAQTEIRRQNAVGFFVVDHRRRLNVFRVINASLVRESVARTGRTAIRRSAEVKARATRSPARRVPTARRFSWRATRRARHRRRCRPRPSRLCSR